MSMPGPDQQSPPEPGAAGGRHGCLTGFLYVVVLLNAGLAIYYLAVAVGLARFHGPPSWTFPVLTVVAAANAVAAVAILAWKKWGLFAFLATSLFMAGLNYHLGAGRRGVFLALAPVVALFALLWMGGKKSAWRRLF